MNEWKELELDDNEHEFNIVVENVYKGSDSSIFIPEHEKAFVFPEKVSIIYRRKEKPAPTHEEIMTKWWKNEDGEWCRVESYNSNDSCYKTDRYCWVKKEWFYVRESADIPPEE